MASVGQVYYDVLPNLDGFAAKVASGLGNAKPIKIPVEVDSAKAAASLKQVSSQTDNLGKSSARLAAAQGRVRVTAAQLNETRQKATAGSAKLVQAEERYAAALRGVKTAQDQDAKVAARNIAVREKAAAASQRAAAKDAAARKQVIQQAGTGLAVGGAAALVALGGIVKVTADFDTAISGVAATGKEARASLGALRGEAIRYGAATEFSATEAAAGQQELLKAGTSVQDVLGGGLKGALDLASAGNLDVAASAEAAATAVNQFSLSGSDFTHVADLMAQVAGTAQGEVSDVAAAFKNGGLTAAEFGLSIDETAQTLAVFAQNGIIGAEAGTKLSSSLINLYAPLGQSKKALDALQISTKDATGNLLPIGDVLDQLKTRLSGLDESARKNALARIFGKENITAGLALIEQGSAGLAKAGKDFQGFGTAADVARVKTDNLRGDIERLGGAVSSLAIETGSGSAGGLRTLTQAATGLIEITSKIPDGLKSVGFIGAGLLATTALGAGGIIKLRGAVTGLIDAFGTLNISGKRAMIATGGIGVGIAAAAAVLGHFAIKSAEAKARTDDLTSALLTSKGAIDGNIASMRAKSLEDTGALKAAQDLGISIHDITQASLGNASAQDRVSEALKRAQAAGDTTANSAAAVSSSYNKNAKSIALVNDAVAGGNRELQNATEAQKRQAAAADAAAGSNKRLGDSLATQQGAARDALAGLEGLEGKPGKLGTDAVNALTTALWGNATAALAAVDAEIAYEQAVDQAAETAKQNKGKGTNTDTETGRENAISLRNQAAASAAYVDSLIKQNKSTKDIVGATKDARTEFVKNATAMTGSKKEAEKLADQYGLIPKKVETKVEAKIEAEKQKKVAAFEASIKGLPKSVQTEVRALVKAGKFDEAKAKVKAYEASLKKIPGNVNVDAKVKPVGVPATKAAIVSIKGKNATIKVSANGIPPTKGQIQSIKGKNVTIQVQQDGVGSVRSQINAIQGKTVFVRVKKEEANAVGGVIGWSKGLPGYATGGVVRGRGGPKEDNIAMLDRATGVQTAWGSVGEMLVNAAQTKKNKEALQAINSGGTWDVVPRYAEGGTIGSTAAPRSVARSLTLNLDLGPVFGGVQRMVIDLMDDRDEYSASIGRMN